MSPRSNRVRDVVCEGCGRTLDLAIYSARPTRDTPEDRIHKVPRPLTPGLSVQCSTCGHYTVYVRADEMP